MVQLFLLVSLFFSAFLPNTYANDLKEKKCVLVIFHAQSDLPAFSRIEQGIKQGLGAGTEFNIEYFIEYMDSDRNPDQKHDQLLSDLYHHKYSKKKIDLIIAYGVASLEFVIARHDDLFQNTPVVFSATRTNIANISLPPEITGVLADIDYAGLLNTALEIHPETRHVAVVNGASHADLFFEEGFRKAFEPYTKQFDFIYLTRLPFAEIEEKVKNLPEQSVILFYLLTQDGNGKAFVPRQAASILAKEANAPVYGILDSYFGDGIVGGRMFSMEMTGVRAGEMALRILRGEKPSNIPMSSQGTTINQFDWRQFKRFGIREDRLPPGSIVQFKTYSFWESYRWYIVGTFFVLFVQSGLILYLMMVRRQRRRALSQLAKRLRFEEMLSALSAGFVNLPLDRVESQIGYSLKMVAEFLEADRGTIFNLSEVDRKLRSVVSYTNTEAGVAPASSQIEFDQLPWIIQKTIDGEKIILADTDQMPAGAEAEKNYFHSHGLRSVVVIPLKAGQSTLGMLSLAMLRIRREWPADLIRQLEMVADILANVLMRWKHEEILQQAEKKYRTVADFTYDWEFWVKVDHTMEYVSPSCERVSGYTVQEFKDDPSLFKAIIVPEDRYLLDCHYRDSQRAQKPSTIQFRILRRDGQIRWIEHSCQQVTDDEGKMLGFRASNRDVTSRKLAEIDLRNAYTEISELKDQLEAETAYLQDEIKIELNFGSIIGNSDALKYALFKVEQVATSDSAVLITGETGTGKELIARAVHNASRYKNRPLVKVDCAALPANLIESELFGYEKGAFSGADARRIGRFELADGTSLFLDEIGELPMELQS
ncbi:MAG: ABC transporter substrate binding protein, partial [Desulfobacteraceae bacterium]|nr:ABC transporter substrate binding protein [Desulfobacteraceae bacterium]